MDINYTKMHGLKNDFIIIDGRDKKISLNKNKIKKISNRKKVLVLYQVYICLYHIILLINIIYINY